MKICKQCAFYKKGSSVYPDCLKTKEVQIDRISGDKIHMVKTCQFSRWVEDLCGYDGKWFEPKKPVFKALLSKIALLCR